MVLLQRIRSLRRTIGLLVAVLCLPSVDLWGETDGVVSLEKPTRLVFPELRLSLREAIQAAIDNNVNVRLLKERIAAAQAQADASFGALLPNVSGYVSGRNQTVNLAAFGLPADRPSGLGLTRSMTEPFEVYDARATLVQNIFSLSLIQRWRAAKTGVDVAGLEAEVTKRDVMAMVGLLYIEALRADDAVKAREADIEISRQLLKLARDRKAAGIATGLDVTSAVPIFDGGQRESRISETRSRVRQESIRMKDLSDQVTLEVRHALLTLESSTQQVAVAEKGLELALKELTFARDRFTAGLGTHIEVTNAQTSVARARDNQIEALFRFNASRINLARAKGEIEKLI